MEKEEAVKKKSMVQLDVRKKADYVSLPEGSDLSQPNKRKGSSGEAQRNLLAFLTETLPTSWWLGCSTHQVYHSKWHALPGC